MRNLLKWVILAAASIWSCNSDAPENAPPDNESGVSEFGYPFENDTKVTIDVLMVIDNTESMCGLQKQLREGSSGFFQEMYWAKRDFHVGITTTQMRQHELEPVALAGQLQSTPQPVPGPDPACRYGREENGTPIPGDYSPVREAISAAVECMEEPRPQDFEYTDAELECAVDGTPDGCSIAAAGCSGDCTIEDVFPDPSQYREFPKVLRARDYEGEDGLDVERLTADFACISMVGTRGQPVEEGLAAAARAVSPELTGGVFEYPTNEAAPNHGLLRAEAEFALYFLTDEGDCSSDGRLDVSSSACGTDLCYFSDAPLTPVAELQSLLIRNLGASKSDDDFDSSHVYVASYHGASRPEGETPTEAECQAGVAVRPVCASTLGISFSGHRYDQFLRQFPASNTYPRAGYDDPESPVPGLACRGDVIPYSLVGSTYWPPSCDGYIKPTYAECGEASDCPDGPYSQGQGECAGYAIGPYYCTSSLQVRALGAESDLRDSGYCIPESIARIDQDRSQCTIDKSLYSLGDCGSIGSFHVGWKRWMEAYRALSGLDLFLYEYDGE